MSRNAYSVFIIDKEQCSIDAHNNPLTDEALAAAKAADAIILGAVGGPVWHYSEFVGFVVCANGE